MADRRLLGLAGALMLVGAALVTVLTVFVHPAGGPTLADTFDDDAASGAWTTIHLGQFAGTAILLLGLLLLLHALDLGEGPSRWLGLLGAATAWAALALAAVLYAVDGVANKRAVDAWASAVGTEKATRFAAADTLRSLEIGTASYQDILFGLALVLVAAVIVATARVPRTIGFLTALAGLAAITVGWLVGSRGFTSADGIPTDVGYTALFAVALWLLLLMPHGSGQPPADGAVETGLGRTAGRSEQRR